MRESYIDSKLFYIWDRRGQEITHEDYLEVIENYVTYYAKSSNLYKYWYMSLSVTKYLVLASIPVSQNFDLPWFATAASALCILLESVTELFHMKEKWNLYRDVQEKLRQR